ncbi:hypothetical protein KUCAC02_029770, partial [Chaenocephalus aceratus]
MLNHKTKFNNQFKEGAGEESIPPSLLQFVCNIEHGVDIKSHLKHGVVKSDLAIAQLLQYNCYTKYRDGSAIHRHSKDRETPFAVYIGMIVFAKTRKRQLIDKLHENGISISYDRVLEISAQLGESVVNQYVEEGVVCPPVLRKQIFTTSAMDNIDHNPTATTASTSFHGTSISMFQHPSSDNKGEVRAPPKVVDSRAKKVPELPESFTNIPPAFFNKKNPAPPSVAEVSMPDRSLPHMAGIEGRSKELTAALLPDTTSHPPRTKACFNWKRKCWSYLQVVAHDEDEVRYDAAPANADIFRMD